MDVQAAVALALPAAGSVVGVIVWLVRLEGRVKAHKSDLDEFKMDVKSDIHYIRQRIDKALNGRRD